MDELPPPPVLNDVPALTNKLVECGLDARGIKVAYVEDIQGYEIEISRVSGADSSKLQCIWNAAWSEAVKFDDAALQEQFGKISADYFEPRLKQEAKDNLAKEGLLEGLPDLAKFPSLAEFAVAVEQHCGLPAHSTLWVSNDTIMLGGPDHQLADYKRAACIFSVLKAAGVTKLGFIGNEVIDQP